jgi:hypothetical protein
MPRFIHLAPESVVKRIRRNGIQPTNIRGWGPRWHLPGTDRLVWSFPVTPNYAVSHQWLRELKRGGVKTLVAVVFCIDDDEVVFARHYSEVPREMSAAAAVGVILSHPEPLGYEVMIPRRIRPTEIVAVRHVAQKLGWRRIPGTQEASICTCPICVPPGTVKSARRRAQFEELQDRRAIAMVNASRAARGMPPAIFRAPPIE